MAGTPPQQQALARFFVSPSGGGARARSGAFAAIRGNDQLLRDAQALYDQILPAGAAASSSTMAFVPADEANARNSESEQEKIWALVAVVATGMTQELLLERRQAEGGRGGDNEEMPTPLTWHLVELLAEADVSLREFLLYFTSLFNRLLLEPELLAATTLLKEEFTIAALLFEKYRVLWEKLVPPSTAAGRPKQVETTGNKTADSDLQETVDPEPESAMDAQDSETKEATKQVDGKRQRQLCEAGWLLFLLAKRRLSAHYSGLGQSYNLLLAVLHLVISTLHGSQRSVEAEVAAALSAMGALGASESKPDPAQRNGHAKTSAEILEALCAAPKVDMDDVARASGHLALVLQHLKDEGALHVAGEETVPLDTAVLGDSVLETNVAQLSKLYCDDYLDGCGKLDERFFLDASLQRVIMGPNSGTQGGDGNGGAKATIAPIFDAAAASSSANRTTGNSMLSPVRRNMMARRRENGASAVIRGTMTPPRHQQQSSLSAQSQGMNSPLMHSWQWQGSPGGARLLPFGASPRPSPASMYTPVTAAVEIGNWVRETLSSTMLTPVPPQLRQFFTDCTSDPTEYIARVLRERSELLMSARTGGRVTSARVRSTAALVMDDSKDGGSDENFGRLNASYSSGVDDSLKRTKNLAVVLFYRVLEPMLRSERERLRSGDFSKLLNNEVFIAALFACCAEVTLKSHSLITLSYPFLLEHLHVNAFHFVTTSESFVKYAPKLPVALKKHMGDVKNRILDSLAWRSDSALFGLLEQGNRTLLGPITPSPVGAASPSTSVINGADHGNGGNNDAAVPTSGSAGHAPVLRLFFRMVLSRAASRVYQLGNLLGLDSTDLNQVWTAVKECVTSHHYLLKDRHLDLIVLCTIYSVCKVSRGPKTSQAASSMSFKRLLASYKQLNRQALTDSRAAGGSSVFASQNTEGVTYNIKLDGDHSRGDIIKFYNGCYIKHMKSFVLQFQLQDSQMAAADAVVANALDPSSTPQEPPPGFTPRKEGTNGAVSLAASSSDAESIRQAASEAVNKLLNTHIDASNGGNVGKNTALPSTPPRPTRRGGVWASPFGSPAVSALQMFTSAEVQTLPVSMHQTSPKRVRSSNVFMSPLQQVRLDRRSQLTPRSHALYAFGESPARFGVDQSRREQRACA
ncbi:hypothetical protein BBJ28_00005742 [Nothophytophthora sp. Chile5]|nr:hypothetical protein BBJ28_00005742 [Nothophytophthora sp. Chile5]